MEKSYSIEKKRVESIEESIANKKTDLSDITKKLEELNKEKTNTNNALQNWQSTYNNFISIQLETKNKQEITY